jgi:Holliday junction resolvase-like predicted endonuclease
VVRQGYRVLQQNWRTRYCEIDIVARKAATIYFIEVKYRASAQYGSGLDYVTPHKLRQMSFAARMWTQQFAWKGEVTLSAIELTGTNFVVTNFIEALV